MPAPEIIDNIIIVVITYKCIGKSNTFKSYIKNTISVGKEYVFYGKVKKGIGRMEVQSPIFEEVGKEKKTDRCNYQTDNTLVTMSKVKTFDKTCYTS